MRQISDFKSKLLLLGIFAGAVFLMWVLKLPCFWQAVFHVPCPGCGLTRACLSLLQLDLAAAFHYHPMFWSIPLLVAYWFLDGKLVANKWGNRLPLALIGLGFAGNWIFKLFIL